MAVSNNTMISPELTKADSTITEHVDDAGKPTRQATAINQAQPEMYVEALARYPNDESIDQKAEKAVRFKIDVRILPLLGVCYFFYYVDKTTL